MAHHDVVTNRRARHEYHLVERIEAGIELVGTEVKSLRAGNAQIAGAYVRPRNREVFLIDAHIDEYEQGNQFNHEPRRPRRLLLHRREIDRLAAAVDARGMTLVPLRIYFRRGRAKLEIGIGRGKRAHDRRDDLKRRQADRDARVALAERNRG